MYFYIFILTLLLPTFLCCDMKEMFAMDSEKGKVVFHDLCDLGAAVINNQIDMVAELIG